MSKIKTILFTGLAGATAMIAPRMPKTYHNPIDRLPATANSELRPVRQGLLSSLRFLESAHATAAGLAPLTFMTSLRDGFGLSIGYGDHDFYVKSACPFQDPPPADGADCTDAPPYHGLVGVVVDYINKMPDLIQSTGIQSCNDIPTSGTATFTDANGTSIPGSYATATHTIPDGWDNAGASFTKRILMSQTLVGMNVKTSLEFSCGQEAGLLAVNMAVGEHAPGYERHINIVFGKTSGLRIADVYLSEAKASGEVRGADAIRLIVDETTSQFQMWSLVTQSPGNVRSIDQAAIHGDFSSKQASVFMKRYNVQTNGSSEAYDAAALAALSGSDSAAVGTASSYDLTQDWCQATSYDSSGYPHCDNSVATQQAAQIFSKQGCINLDSPDAALANATLCSGLDLASPSAPSADASGSFNPQWLISTMPSKIDVSGLDL